MPHRFNKLPPISLGPRPCGCFPGEVLYVCEAAGCRHPSLTVWTTRVSNTDRTPYVRGSAPSRGGGPPWPLGARTPSSDFTPQACKPPTSPGCRQRGGLSRAPSALWPGSPAPRSHALRPVTTGNAFSAMSYRNCWHIFGPRLGGWRRNLRPPRLALDTAPGAETLDRALAQWLRFLTAADGGAISGPRWLADRPAQLGIVGCLGTPNPARVHPTAALPAPRAAGSVGQHLVSYAPLGRPGPRGAGARLACVRRSARIRPKP